MHRIAVCALLALTFPVAGCENESSMVEVPGDEPRLKSSAPARAERRAYDGAPPVVAHEDFGIECTSCHDQQGVEVDDVGFAPPMPHEETAGLSGISRCRQCHVPVTETEAFTSSLGAGLTVSE